MVYILNEILFKPKEEILHYDNAQINLEGIMLSERAEKDKRCMWKLREKKTWTQRNRGQIGGCQGWGLEEMGEDGQREPTSMYKKK